MSGTIIVRAAESEDADALLRVATGKHVRHGTLQMPYQSLVSWRERLATEKPGFHRLVAERDGQVVGMAGLLVVESPRRRHVGQMGMMVRDDHQGMGIGRALLEAILDLADNWLNLHRIELEVYTDNAAGIHLYESHGFVIEGTMRDYAYRNGKYVDAFGMARLRSR